MVTLLTDGLLHCWELTNTKGNEADDISGGTTLTQVGNYTEFPQTGVGEGWSHLFPVNVADYLDGGDITNLDGLDNLSFSYFVRPAIIAAGDQWHITKIGTGTFGWEHWMQSVGNIRTFSLSGGGTTASWDFNTDAFHLTSNAWFHIIITIPRNGTGVIYVDGVSRATGAITNLPIDAGTSKFYVGRRERDTGSPMNGYLDKIKIWNRIISADEIIRVHNSGYGLTYAQMSGNGGSMFQVFGQ